MNLFRSHITRLFDAAGRENRKPFWLWYLVVYACIYALQTVIMIPTMFLMMGRIAPLMQAAATTDPLTGKPVPPDPAVVMGAMGPMMYAIFGIVLFVVIVQLVLVTAAAVRRLHDRDWSGRWLAPLIALQLGVVAAMMVVFPTMFSHLPPPGSTAPPPPGFFIGFGLMSLTSMVQLGYMIFMIVLLCLPGTVGPNRFGADPLEGQRMPEAGWPPAPPRTTATIVPSAMREPPPLA